MAGKKPKTIILPPIKETTDEYIGIERQIKKAFLDVLYKPLLKIVNPKDPTKLLNAEDSPVQKALKSGDITFHAGAFAGKFSSQTSRQLRKLGAVWDKDKQMFKILKADLPKEIQDTIAVSANAFNETLLKVEKELAKVLPEDIAERVHSQKIFDDTLWKVDKKIGSTLKSISVLPKLSKESVKRISEEWQENMDLYIKKFAEEQIVDLRKNVLKHTMQGGRYEDLVGSIQSSYGVTERKAHFLARQETSLMTAKFKETRYQEAGVDEYIWGCVAGSAKHPVRPAHKALQGKTFRWDEPPITTEPSEPVRRNNPGQDYNCRCFAKPIVRFDE